MPLLILAALVVIVLMLYIALGGKEGAPTVSLNKILDFIMPKAQTDEAAQNADAAKPKADGAAAPNASAEAPDANASAERAKTDEAVKESPAAAEERTETVNADGAPESEAFSSMEELTEFYRKEAERLTGIKH
jgi:hypothetical protein